MNRIQHVLDKAVQGERLSYDEGCSLLDWHRHRAGPAWAFGQRQDQAFDQGRVERIDQGGRA